MNCLINLVLFSILVMGFQVPVFCYEYYQTVLENWIWDDPALVNYETCRNAVTSLRYDVPKNDPDFSSVMGMNDVMSFRSLDPTGLARSSVIHKTKLWSNGEVPYSIPYGMSIEEKKILACAFLFFHEKTCVRFVPNHHSRPNRDFVSIRKTNGGCFSEDMGKKGGQHIVNLHYPYCWDQGTIIHELMHAIGFFHEQSRNDRDKYITVHWENIPDQSWRYQFLTGRESGVGQQLIGKYDYGSIMHYPRISYAWGYRPTMTAKRGNVEENNRKMGNRAKPTAMDIQKINILYSCHGSGKGTKPQNDDDSREDGKKSGEKVFEKQEQPTNGTWLVPVIVVTALLLFGSLLVLGIFVYRKRTQIFNHYRSFSDDNSPAKSGEKSATKKEQVSAANQHVAINFRPPNQHSSCHPQRPQRPRDTVIQNLHEEIGHELDRNRWSWIFKKPKPVPQRKAPPPPQDPEHQKTFAANSKVHKTGKNDSTVKAMKEKFENLS